VLCVLCLLCFSWQVGGLHAATAAAEQKRTQPCCLLRLGLQALSPAAVYLPCWSERELA